jgi:hypothetical protein
VNTREKSEKETFKTFKNTGLPIKTFYLHYLSNSKFPHCYRPICSLLKFMTKPTARNSLEAIPTNNSVSGQFFLGRVRGGAFSLFFGKFKP